MNLYKLEDKEYNVKIVKKNNKNTYVRVNDDIDIVVTTSFLTPEKSIIKLLDNNQEELKKMIDKKCKRKELDNKFNAFGKSYDIIIDDNSKNICMENNTIYVPNMKMLDKWLLKESKRIYLEHLDQIYNLFEEKIPYPKLKIRNMKTRWGVCNKRDNSVTLNSKLIEYSLEKLDYVIIHELSHFVHFDHSKLFWETVSKYCPNYKKIRKELKE